MGDELTQDTLGARLLEMKERSGLSLAQIAAGAGYRSASAIQRFFNVDYDPAQPNQSVGRRLAVALEGRGQPSIEKTDVLTLFGDDEFAKEADHSFGGGWGTHGETIPITNASLVNEPIAVFGLEFLEVFTRKYSGSTFKTPTHLTGTALAAFYVPASNMWPKYEVGELVVFDATRPVKAGECAVVRLTSFADARHVNFIAKIDRIHRDRISFSQYNPEKQFDVPVELINFIARIVTAEDLLPNAVTVASLQNQT